MPLLTAAPFLLPARVARRLRARRLALALARVVAIAVLSSPPSAYAAAVRAAVTSEYDLKAAFLFNFAQFVEWPADAFADAGTPIVIGVLGEDPFGKSLDDIVAGETVHNRPLAIRRFRAVDQVDSCQILFISLSESARLDQVLKALEHRSILTVGETKDFTTRAGIIGFEVTNRRLRLRINTAAATAAKLTISSKLLRQAETAESRSGRP